MASRRQLLAATAASAAWLALPALTTEASSWSAPRPHTGAVLLVPAQVTKPRTCQAEALMRAVTRTCINGRIRECRWYPNQAYPPCTFTHHCAMTVQRC